MKTYQEEIHLETSGHRDMQRIDDAVQSVVTASGIRTGLVHVFNVGSTGVICMIEYEPGLIGDLPDILDKLMPPSRAYGHEQAWHDGNGHSHLQASILGPDLTVPISNSTLCLGTWQQIVHLECDVKPRHRTVVITVQGA